MKISPAEAYARLEAHEGKPFLQLFRHGSMSVEIYAPQGRDRQQPHAQDEIYVVIQGHGIFRHGDTTCAFGPGDWLFVPAGLEHRFLEFSADFQTWVIFYGPPGGEAQAAAAD